MGGAGMRDLERDLEWLELYYQESAVFEIATNSTQNAIDLKRYNRILNECLDIKDSLNKTLRDRDEKKQKRIEQLEETLKFYANYKNYTPHKPFAMIVWDNGKRAREVLRKNKGE